MLTGIALHKIKVEKLQNSRGKLIRESLINSVRPELVEGRTAQDIDSSGSPFMVRQAHHERRELIRVSLGQV
jgi:hypothetical protein